MEHARDQFQVGWEELVPETCGACGYLMKGLAEARCPECGEKVEDGEVVIVGERYPARGESFSDLSWGQQMMVLGIGLGLAMTMVVWTRRPKMDDVVVYGVICLVLAGIITLMSFILRRRGWPGGVLRISEKGYRFGAGETMGSLRRWPRGFRFSITQNRGQMRVRGIRYVGRLAMWSTFDLLAALSDEQVAGIAERVARWTGGTEGVGNSGR